MLILHTKKLKQSIKRLGMCIRRVNRVNLDFILCLFHTKWLNSGQKDQERVLRK